jgi:hypothetical protein
VSADERDDLVASALGGIAVPDHGPAFWDELEAGLRDAPAPAAAATTADGRRHAAATGDLPVVTAIPPRRPNRRAPLLVAAAVLVLVGAVGFVTLGGDGENGDEVADQPLVTAGPVGADTTTPEVGGNATDSASSLPAGDTTTIAGVATGSASTPDGVVRAWLDALGGGDVAAAAALTGPRTVRYVEALGPDVTLEGFLTESQEGFGAWAGADDLTIELVPIGPLDFDGGTLQVVVVSGTYPGEGGDAGERHDVFPLVDDGEGFRVEHLAFDPARDNDPVFTLPRESETGLAPIEPTDEVNVFVPAQGTVYFQLDGGEVVTDETSEVGERGDPFALFDPPGDLAPGEHVLVLVAVGDDGTIAHFGGRFAVAA